VTAGMGLGSNGQAVRLAVASQAVIAKGVRQLIRQLAQHPGRQILVRLSQPLVEAISGQGQGQGGGQGAG